MKLIDIIKNSKYEVLKGNLGMDISGIEHDSRKVTKGNMFIAINGFTVDGHNYIGEAIEKGANCIVVEKDVPIVECNITVIKVPSTTDALAQYAAKYYEEPSKKIKIIGVTGTNGKTTTTYLLNSIFSVNNNKAGIIGTLGALIDGKLIKIANTTPDALTIQEHLKAMVDSKTEYCMMEVSSHSLDLNRVECIDFQVGIFTNLTEDHLDYHQNMENYYHSKLKLFYKTNRFNIINGDDKYGRRLLDDIKNSIPIITYGLDEKWDIYANEIRCHGKGVDFILNTPKGSIPVNMKLLGKFNVYNALAAASCAFQYGLDLSTIKKGIEALYGIKGRFEAVPIDKDFNVIIDFAHTPDGLEKVLTTIDQFAEGKKVVVFGAGGNRDRSKRPIMGETVAKHADLCIVTSDNPRFEDPDKIIEDILIGVKRVNGNYVAITDRREAIEYALRNAQPKDIILLAGKGHETYTIIKDKVIPFDEKEIVYDILNTLEK
ncbi:UDP-N-acetylmuramoyl-L-alanyl-D-glutamate--2,6-diaminopimelate ligase [Tepidimicrobium xylanilyticum]|uniref:UDP-N-acetylmuramoyl-L-alanyl-D-glutamate--2,6-diaminopimelate ligase n=1 Tax=Tepidimicrobium xylanilyticum TaxID=1123352 RepID=A0A1H2SRA8_9FIRM|nr:UDP-N-acetylmuramoyl-L-alanyl-D-glutamate--2,6-diaminopimelate ligase [Tepidimicrobium xylanilyticum]GMG96145.1 UDP-N-acetylmuramoyl-L-alanyl-D-glutamate--2,6-diaminopimelate ligase [Tepidimicrobium xylanilyticum]SDW34005.1 UDP-N-acetylmuramoylalanyl-D-glutamate--2,6-diaminopimelate ligase [Tepidimicrobium xylanilyticum]